MEALGSATAVGFMFAVHVPIAGLALTPLVFGLPVLFGTGPHRLYRNGYRPGRLGRVRGGGRGRRRHAQTAKAPSGADGVGVVRGLKPVQGLFAFAIVAGVLYSGLKRGMPMDEVRALTFFALILVTTGLILINRSFSASVWTAVGRPNRARYSGSC